MTKRKRINKDLQNITQKTKDRATGIPLRPFFMRKGETLTIHIPRKQKVTTVIFSNKKSSISLQTIPVYLCSSIKRPKNG